MRRTPIVLLWLYLLPLVVIAGNELPRVDMPTTVDVTSGSTLNLQLTVTDPDGDMPAVFLLSAPDGMKLIRWSAERMLLTWTPVDADAGEHRIILQLEDARDQAIIVRRELLVSVLEKSSVRLRVVPIKQIQAQRVHVQPVQTHLSELFIVFSSPLSTQADIV
ncbi:MAG: hypothetical protein KTR32_25210 [Granulosicoccus sp.]|nr:hypothetical protein [Granulosicoccus sp.]